MLGTWWLPPSHSDVPSDIRHERPGYAVFDDDSLKLTVHGVLRESSSALPLSRNEPLIWGETIDGKRITLFDTICIGRKSSFFNTPRPTEEWTFGWYAKGSCHLRLDTPLKGLTIRFRGLTEWVCCKEGVSKLGQGSANTPRGHLNLVAAVDGAQVILYCGRTETATLRSSTTSHYHEFMVRDSFTVENAFNKWLLPLQRMLTFLTLQLASIKGNEALIADSEQRVRLHPSIPDITNKHVEPEHSRFEMLATRERLMGIGIELDQLIDRWFILEKSHATSLGLMHRLYHGPSLDPDAALLICFRALEAYHHRVYGSKVMPKGEHKERVQLIIDTVPDQHKSWVKEALESRNRKGQRKILGEIMEGAGKTGEQITGVWPKFSDMVLKQRQKAAHPADSSYEDTLKSYGGFIGLQWILRYVYLLELGVPSKNASEIISQSSVFQNDIGRLVRLYSEVNTSIVDVPYE